MAIVTSAQWPSVVQKDLSLVFVDQYRGFPSMLPLIYRFKMAEQGTEYDLETGDIGNPQVFNGGIYYDTVSEGYKKSVQETQYALGLSVTRQLLRNDRYGAVRDTVGLIAQAFRHLRESQGAFPFVNAFNGAFTTGDGLSWCNAAHTSNNGGPNFSNTNTLAFSAPNIQANRLLMKKIPSNRGNPILNIPDTLIVPMDLEDIAYEILESMGKVDTANNNRNYAEGRYKLIVWDNYLTSATNWWMSNSKRMNQELVWRDWEKTSFYRSGEFDTLTTKFAGYTSFGVSTVESRYLFGSSN
jgi:hypothetical protein